MIQSCDGITGTSVYNNQHLGIDSRQQTLTSLHSINFRMVLEHRAVRPIGYNTKNEISNDLTLGHNER